MNSLALVKPIGRPTKLAKLADSGRALVLAEIRRGATPKCAAAMAKVHEATWYRWLERGRAGIEPYASFATEIAIAELVWQAGLERAIASSTDWRASAWLLERRCREQYGRNPPASPPQATGALSTCTDAELVAVIEQARRSRQREPPTPNSP